MDTIVIRPGSEASYGELLAQAHRLWVNGNPQRAAAIFDELRSVEPRGALAPWVSYWSGLAHEAAGAHRVAGERLEALGLAAPRHPLAADAQLRAVRLWVYVDEWPRAARLAERLLALPRRWLPAELAALHSARALGLLLQGQTEDASYHVGKGQLAVSHAGLDRLDVIPRDVAQLYFALGELRRQRGAQLTFEPLPPDFAEHFERRAQLLLDAQGAYLDAMRARDAHWSALAGFRIGELYEQLHSDVAVAPLPPAVPEARREVFRAAMRLRYLVLLEKGVAMYARTLEMVNRTGEESGWVERARRHHGRLARHLAAENEALDAGPLSRQDLARVLDGITARQGGAPSEPSPH